MRKLLFTQIIGSSTVEMIKFKTSSDLFRMANEIHKVIHRQAICMPDFISVSLPVIAAKGGGFSGDGHLASVAEIIRLAHPTSLLTQFSRPLLHHVRVGHTGWRRV